MRTTLTLSESAAEFAAQYAAARSLRLGQAVSELILSAQNRQTDLRFKPVKRGGVWVFDLPADTPMVTSAQVKAFLEDGA